MSKIRTQLFFIIPFLLLVLFQIPHLFEGPWYGDEGIYAAVGTAMAQGKQLYTEIWDHKPPLILWIYTFFFQFDFYLAIFAINLLKVTLNLFSFVLLAKIMSLLNITKRIQGIALLIASVLLGTTVLEGNVFNAEILFVPINLLLLYWLLQKRFPTGIGFLLFLGFVTKFHGFAEGGFLLLAYVIAQYIQTQKFPFTTIFSLKLVLGFLIPMVVMLFGFFWQGNLLAFWEAAFAFNFQYSGHSQSSFSFLAQYQTWILIGISCSVLAWTSVLLAHKKLTFRVFIVLSLLNIEGALSLIGGKNYLHYFYQLIPAFVFSLALLVTTVSSASLLQKLYRTKLLPAVMLGVLYSGIFLQNGFFTHYVHPVHYYSEFISQHVLRSSNGNFWWGNIDRPQTIASRINAQLSVEDEIYVYTNDAWIIPLLQPSVSNRFVVSFHLGYDAKIMEQALAQMQNSDYILYDTYGQKYEPVQHYLDTLPIIDTHEYFVLYSTHTTKE